MVLPLVLLCSIDQHDKHFGFKILYSTWIRKNFLLVLHPEEAPALGNVHTILTIPHRFFQVKLFPDPCMCALWRALPSGLSRVCSPLQTWLAATAEKALSEWKVTLWHCDIGGFFFFGLIGLEGVFSFVANEVCWKHYKDTTPSNQTNKTHCTCFTQSPLKAVQMHSSSLRPTSMFLISPLPFGTRFRAKAGLL